MRTTAYHHIVNELLGGLKTLEVIWVSETLEAPVSPLSSPTPRSSQDRSSQEHARPFTQDFWQLAEAFQRRKESSGGTAG